MRLPCAIGMPSNFSCLIQTCLCRWATGDGRCINGRKQWLGAKILHIRFDALYRA